MPNYLILGDVHAPWCDNDALSRTVTLAKQLKPDFIIQVGDLYDMYSFSSYRRTLNTLTPEQEFDEGQRMTQDLWRRLRKTSPKSKCFQLSGNHDARAMNRCLEKLPEAEHWVRRGVNDLFKFEGVVSIMDASEELILNGIFFQHGHKKMGEHAGYNKANTVHGHSHRGGLVFTSHGHWELDVGWLGDRKAKCFSYKAQKRLDGTTLGVGYIDSLGPRFIPFEAPRDLEKESLVIKGH